MVHLGHTEGIITNITTKDSIRFEDGYIICKCRVPTEPDREIRHDSKYQRVLSKMYLPTAKIVIEDNTVDSNMEMQDFRRFTQERNYVFSGDIVQVRENVYTIHNIVFTNSVRKKNKV